MKMNDDYLEERYLSNRKEAARAYIRAVMRINKDVPDQMYKIAEWTRRDAEMEEKLRRIVEDPEKYYAEKRKEYLKEIKEENRQKIKDFFTKPIKWLTRNW